MDHTPEQAKRGAWTHELVQVGVLQTNDRSVLYRTRDKETPIQGKLFSATVTRFLLCCCCRPSVWLERVDIENVPPVVSALSASHLSMMDTAGVIPAPVHTSTTDANERVRTAPNDRRNMSRTRRDRGGRDSVREVARTAQSRKHVYRPVTVKKHNSWA